MQALGDDIIMIEGVRKTIVGSMHIFQPIDKTFVIEKALYESISGEAGQELMQKRISDVGQGAS